MPNSYWMPLESKKTIFGRQIGHFNFDIYSTLLLYLNRLYMEGYNPKVEALYPKVEFPVSSGTPMLSHLVDWAHHERW